MAVEAHHLALERSLFGQGSPRADGSSRVSITEKRDPSHSRDRIIGWIMELSAAGHAPVGSEHRAAASLGP